MNISENEVVAGALAVVGWKILSPRKRRDVKDAALMIFGALVGAKQ